MGTRKITGLEKRGAMWWLRVMIPKTLQAPFYEGRTKLRFSLGTADNEQARVLALAKHAHYAAEFAKQRAQLNPSALVDVSPEFAGLLAARLRQKILALDDAVRFDPGPLDAFMRTFRLQKPRFLNPADPVEFEDVPAGEPSGDGTGTTISIS